MVALVQAPLRSGVPSELCGGLKAGALAAGWAARAAGPASIVVAIRARASERMGFLPLSTARFGGVGAQTPMGARVQRSLGRGGRRGRQVGAGLGGRDVGDDAGLVARLA